MSLISLVMATSYIMKTNAKVNDDHNLPVMLVFQLGHKQFPMQFINPRLHLAQFILVKYHDHILQPFLR